MQRSFSSRPAPVRLLGYLLFSMLLLIPLRADAIDLDTARRQGLAGETDSGLLARPPQAGDEARPLITTVNAQRKTEYTRIATQNGITADVVGRMMFEKLYPTLPSGTWVRIDGEWSKK
ncbi:DUF1318 domain-containing protein [Prosthecochloris sp. ZM_2]|uniref:YdbL family protein n=1 Tax=Prosthecochloris sp. ZM_2 TaxID=2045206 RepID=UPI000DF80369|nr:YdbL family protein [Prosthecochloris sp. ZM_2]RNA66109.1 DUF1318 domain-containing protein [Prosthecochloris sp. ZM_2]